MHKWQTEVAAFSLTWQATIYHVSKTKIWEDANSYIFTLLHSVYTHTRTTKGVLNWNYTRNVLSIHDSCTLILPWMSEVMNFDSEMSLDEQYTTVGKYSMAGCLDLKIFVNCLQGLTQ